MVLAAVCALALTQEPSRPSFSEWLAAVRAEALSRGIRQETVEEALGSLDEPLPIVLDRDRAQAETVFSLEKYFSRILTPKFLTTGREVFETHKALVGEIGDAYGVDPRVIIAIWGMESNYGRFSGVRPTIAALATLAWDPRRSAFFRGELFKALEILDHGDIDLAHMRGSWAGAMGQVQFMPSSYLEYAQDYDGDGRRDIWSTTADVFASIANYLSGHGWVDGRPWAREVKVSRAAERRINTDIPRRAGSCRATRDMTVLLPVKRWRELGVRTASGGALPLTMPDAALVSGQTRHFLVHSNYDALLEYNCSHSYALSVALVADRIARPASQSVRRKAAHGQ